MITLLKRSILIIEDSDEDFETIERVVRQTGLAKIIRATNGEQGLRLLRDEIQNQCIELILLDLNMPGLDGRDILLEIKNDEKLRLLPVVIFTTSSNPRDIQSCYCNGANSYHLKPIDLHDFEAVVEVIVDYWLNKNVSNRTGADL